jgi:hypothetical protein
MSEKEKAQKRRGLHEDFKNRLHQAVAIAEEKATNKWFSIDTYLALVSLKCGVRTQKAKEYYTIVKLTINEENINTEWTENDKGEFQIKTKEEEKPQ